MIMRKITKGEGLGTAKLWSYPGMAKLVETPRNGMTRAGGSRADRGAGPRSLGTQNRAGLPRLCQVCRTGRVRSSPILAGYTINMFEFEFPTGTGCVNPARSSKCLQLRTTFTRPKTLEGFSIIK
jgi:hypothetical protein